MKIHFSLIFSLFVTLFFAQNQEFTYEYQYVSDSTNTKDISKEIMILNVGKEKSSYYSYEKYISDSTLIADSKKGLMTMPPNKKMIDEVIYKVPSSKKITFNTRVADSKYTVQQEVNLKWNLMNEFDEILNYKVQKATIDFGGRKWTAWFAKDIPLQDGPYKFHGLPGLILKIEDATLSHRFQLKGIKNKAITFDYPELKNYSGQAKVDFSVYVKAYLQHRADPAANLIGRTPDQRDSQGNFRTGNQIIREQRKLMLEKISKDNNIIEINILKSKGKSKK